MDWSDRCEFVNFTIWLIESRPIADYESTRFSCIRQIRSIRSIRVLALDFSFSFHLCVLRVLRVHCLCFCFCRCLAANHSIRILAFALAFTSVFSASSVFKAFAFA